MENKKPAILVTGAGGGASQSIIKSLNMTKQYRVITTDVDPLSPGVYRGSPGYLVSRDWKEYIEQLIEICKREKVDVFIPGSDLELEIISKNQKRIENESGAKVIIGTPEAIEIGNDKWETYKFLLKNGFRGPNSCLPSDIENGELPLRYPVVVKPRFGWASMHLYVALNYLELKSYITHIESAGLKPIIQELIPDQNQEYTTGILFSKDKELLGAITVWRVIKKGLSYKVIVDDYHEIKEKMIKIASKLDTYGPINIQCRMWNNEPYVFEINTRFSGTTVVQSAAGFNGPDVSVKNYLFNQNIKLNKERRLVGMLYNTYIYVKPEEYREVLEQKNINKTGADERGWF